MQQEGDKVDREKCFLPDCGDYMLEYRTIRRKKKPLCFFHLRRRDAGVKSATILKGAGFDWVAGAEATNNIVTDDDSVNWRAAFAADPGIMHCPECGVFHWLEGDQVQCAMADCMAIWRPAETDS